jgi:hypothetical protein
VLCVIPPQYSIAEQLRARIDKYERRLAENGETKTEAAMEAALQEIDNHKDIARLFESYTVWRAECPLQEKNGKERELWKEGRALLLPGFHQSADEAFMYADPFIAQWGDPDILTAKGKCWHSQSITEKQYGALVRYGDVVELKNAYRVPGPSPDEIKAMNRGDAAALRSHIVGTALVTKSLQKLIKQMFIDEDIWYPI